MHLCLKLNNEIRIEFCEWSRLERRIQRARRENDLSSRQRKTGMPRTRSYDSVRGTQTDIRIEYEPSFFVDVAVKYPRSCHVVVRSSVLFDTPVLTESIYFERWHSWSVQRGFTKPSRVTSLNVPQVSDMDWVRERLWVSHGTSSYLLGCLLLSFHEWKNDLRRSRALARHKKALE